MVCLLLGSWLSNAQTIELALAQANEYYAENNYSSAHEGYLQVLQIAEEEGKSAIMVQASMSIAKCHYYMYDHMAAFKWTYHALELIKTNKLDSLLADTYYFLGALYIEDENIDSAEKYSSSAIQLMTKENNYAGLSKTYSTLAELYMNTTRNQNKIEQMIANAEHFGYLSKDKNVMAFAASKSYNYNFFLKKNYSEALNHINRAETLYLESNNREAILNTYRGKAECLIMLGDTTARWYMLRWFEFKDSVLQAEKSEHIAKFETLYQTEKKEQQNKILSTQNQVNLLKIESKNRAIILIVFATILLVLIALLVIVRINLKRKKQELELLQNLQQDRERIARDLHDNIGGKLSFIVYSLDGFEEDDKSKRAQLTESVNQTVRSVIGSLRETIWAISDANITAWDFSDKLKIFSKNIFRHSQTQVIFSENIVVKRELNALLGLNLYRISQEILNNAFKYAEATEVKIQIDCTAESLSIFISDNGKGFDTTLNKQESYGLQNIKKRAHEFGITLQLESKIDSGTKYVLIV